jgi:hypothetical protein
VGGAGEEAVVSGENTWLGAGLDSTLTEVLVDEHRSERWTWGHHLHRRAGLRSTDGEASAT